MKNFLAILFVFFFSVNLFAQVSGPYLSTMAGSNMPTGFNRQRINDANGNLIGNALFFTNDGNLTKTSFLTNDLHESFSPEIDFSWVNRSVQNQNREMVFACAAAYRSPIDEKIMVNDGSPIKHYYPKIGDPNLSEATRQALSYGQVEFSEVPPQIEVPQGQIEGVSIENGHVVGENKFSKWAGFVYINPNGIMEMYRFKDSQGNFEAQKATALIERAKNEDGSMFQQIPAIWHGERKLLAGTTAQPLFLWRGIVQTRKNEWFVINTTTKMTQDHFVQMCTELKDSKGNLVVYNLMMEDTGAYEAAALRDEQQINQTRGFDPDGVNPNMVDFDYYAVSSGGQTKGFTNVLVFSVPR